MAANDLCAVSLAALDHVQLRLLRTMAAQESVAVTHNYVSGAGLASALAFLGTRSADLVSGCEGAGARTGLHARFLAALQQRRPEVMGPSP